MQRATAYKPTGYCPRCGYATEPGVCAECGRSNAKVRQRPKSKLRKLIKFFALCSIFLTAMGGIVAYWLWWHAPMRTVGEVSRIHPSFSWIFTDIADRRTAVWQKRVNKLFHRLKAESPDSTLPWRGKYEVDSAQMYIGEYEFVCTSSVGVYSSGTVDSISDEELVLRHIGRTGESFLVSTFVPAHLRGKQVLIPTEKIPLTAAHWRHGCELALWKRSDSDDPPILQDDPICIATEYCELFAEVPRIELNVLSFRNLGRLRSCRSRNWEYEFFLDRGSQDGLRPGHILRATRDSIWPRHAIVTSVQTTTCTVEMSVDWESAYDPDWPYADFRFTTDISH